MARINDERRNPFFLAGVELPPGIAALSESLTPA
jgi:hypothetical protein